MAKQPEDHTTTDMFGPIGHSMTFGKTGSGKTALQLVENARVSRFRAGRKMFPAKHSGACEVCGRKHSGSCESRK